MNRTGPAGFGSRGVEDVGAFMRLTLSKFAGALGRDALKILTSYEDKLYNLRLVESCGVFFIFFFV